MAKPEQIDISQIEGQTFVIGRDGHIYIDDDTVSRRHASIAVTRGKIYLKDLGSKNGTFLIRHDRMHMFDEGNVSLLQTVVIGDRKYRIIDLLKIACNFYRGDDVTTQVPSRAAAKPGAPQTKA